MKNTSFVYICKETVSAHGHKEVAQVYIVDLKKSKSNSMSECDSISRDHPVSIGVIINFCTFFDFLSRTAARIYSKFCVAVPWVDP